MPKVPHLFGRYLRNESAGHRRSWRKYVQTRYVVPKAMGQVPSAASQMALFHDDDYKRKYRMGVRNSMFRKVLKPFTTRRDFRSDMLNQTIHNLRVTNSALYAIEDKGGFDEYIMRSPPEEMRSNAGEKMRNVMYWYMQHPEYKALGLPWKVFLRKRNQLDPAYARYTHELKKYHSVRHLYKQHAKFSPYYLPKHEKGLYPVRQKFMAGSEAPEMVNKWWTESPALEDAFRRRLGEAKSFEEAHADHREPEAYRRGYGMGRGGEHGGMPRWRSKTYKFRQLRPY
ncbi:hypothetical protein FOZ61_001658 [Perkinsus olseni]|uniref:39S ribosomal protein L28, mitochondrial n=1 Tax=Perkinsus olseni TaxID=32597 RepID=A0A7J6MI22_PEROL|nr:hypothetical protein FOZ61_001658 [Perkinsus olseni]KAF4670860.1 hypothetical protein FOL46_000591 [Perkinsus olseni]